MKVDREAVLDRRRQEQRALVERAQVFADSLDPRLGVVAVVVFGSVARGDFNLWSDVDVLVIADHLEEGWLERIVSVGEPPALVQPMVWTPSEWATQLARNNAAALEAVDRGMWLVGSADDLDARSR